MLPSIRRRAIPFNVLRKVRLSFGFTAGCRAADRFPPLEAGGVKVSPTGILLVGSGCGAAGCGVPSADASPLSGASLMPPARAIRAWLADEVSPIKFLSESRKECCRYL